MKTLKSISAALLISVSAYAQKLPNVQQGSLRAPANTKIDGKLTEWNDKFQAYNDVNRMFYTIANDADNLYLVIRLANEGALNKVFHGGITFSVNGTGQSKEKVAITYPIDVIGFRNDKYEAIQFSHGRYRMLKKEGATTDKLNELVKTTNKQIASYFKDIQVTGIKEITNPTIPIYNTENIQTVVAFNDQMEYIYEMAVPLKFIRSFITDNKLKYNIKMNARPTIKTNANVPPMPSYNGNDLELLYQNHPSDFSGEYTLAK